jgi:glycosyltransferase involved in cell wall biosynthesis
MRILIITWHFPPWNETAGNRPYSWARYFAAQGHPTTVLTSRKDPRLHPDLSTPVEPHPNLTVVETPLRLTRTPVAKGASWAAGSVWRARQLARRHDIIISTFMPWYVHVLGWFAKRANPAAGWCADYRDLWHGYDFFMEGRPWKQRFAERFEKFIVGPADLTTTVSPPLAASLARTHPHIPSHTIYNGFPESEYQGARPVSPPASEVPFDIVHTGTVYEGGYHDPEPLFRVVAEGTWRRPVRLWFYGQSAHSTVVAGLAEKYRLQEVVMRPEKPLSRIDCVRRQREAQLLLHLGWTNREMDGVLSAKIFEYVASGTPVLSVGAPPDTAIGRFLAETRAGLCAGRDDALLRQTLDRLVNRGDCSPWYDPQKEAILAYTRERQAARLLELVLKCQAQRRAGSAGSTQA